MAARLEQAAKKLVNRRLGLERARLPAAPLSSSKRFTAWLEAMPFKTSAPQEFFRSLWKPCPSTTPTPRGFFRSVLHVPRKYHVGRGVSVCAEHCSAGFSPEAAEPCPHS